MRVLDLFSGIGGFSLGFERAGMKTVAFCEVDAAARRVLKKHWPNVPIYEDVKTLNKQRLDADGIAVDLICGGFPCQDISFAGKGAGLAGERSGLWYEFHRLIEEIRPQYAVIENVSALRSRGLDAVLSSLTEIGYDAQWHCISASAVGAPHQRDRIWIVAYANDDAGQDVQGSSREAMADASGKGLPRGKRLRNYLEETIRGRTRASLSVAKRCAISGGTIYPWHTEPGVGRVADGIPGRVDRLKQLGNAVVPQIPELIGHAILQVAE